MRKHWSLRYRQLAHPFVALLFFASPLRFSHAEPTPRPPTNASQPDAAKADPASIDAATGYRIANYRAPVTRPVEGGARISLDELDKLSKEGAGLVDVMPARAGYDPRTGRWRLVEKRDDIPASLWLPNVGQGSLEPRLEAYFANSLQRLTKGDRNKPLVFYCMADCWMSWNAVKRAAGFGYRNVKWYAEGTDGWTEAGRPLVAATPPPVPALTDKRKTPAD